MKDIVFDRPLLYGLTGGMGSGKSTAARHFEENGARIIDADQVVRDLQAPGSAMLGVMEGVLGEGIIVDGKLDRQEAANRIFANQAINERLKTAMNPGIYAEIGRRALRMPLGEAVIIDVPLLESKSIGELELDGVIVVDTPPELAIQRLEEGRDISEAEAQRRLSQQISREERLQLADHVITNDGSIEHLHTQVDEVYEALKMERIERFVDTLEPRISPDIGDFSDVRPYLLEIVSAYGGESRFYHNMTHLEEMANFLLQRLDTSKNPKGVLVGMIVHDKVYNAAAYTVKAQNETESWETTKEALSLFYGEDVLQTARNCTLATIDHLNHPVGVDSDVDIFLDADMAVLASSWERFQEYEQGIFREFTYTPSGELRISREAYANGRLQFLKSLQGKRIFRTKGMEKSEERVQENLIRMISVLEDEIAA